MSRSRISTGPIRSRLRLVDSNLTRADNRGIEAGKGGLLSAADTVIPSRPPPDAGRDVLRIGQAQGAWKYLDPVHVRDAHDPPRGLSAGHFGPCLLASPFHVGLVLNRGEREVFLRV